MKSLSTQKLYCFSPPVMLATFLIEIGLALYLLWRYKMSTVLRLAVAILVSLAVFQVAEYNICEGAWGLSSLAWAKVGYVAITLLPPLGIHLATKLAGQKRPTLVAASYVAAAAFASFFLFVGNGVAAEACLGNYVIFKQAPGTEVLYTVYYYGLMLVGTGYSLWQANKTTVRRVQYALRSLAVGYIVFIVPTTAVNLVDPSTIQGIPSIMCGFAVLLAIILATNVVPVYEQKPLTDVSKKKK